jgi:hypothetical protein
MGNCCTNSSKTTLEEPRAALIKTGPSSVQNTAAVAKLVNVAKVKLNKADYMFKSQ